MKTIITTIATLATVLTLGACGNAEDENCQTTPMGAKYCGQALKDYCADLEEGGYIDQMTPRVAANTREACDL